MRNRMNRIIYIIAECQDCFAQWEDYKTARRQTYAHAKSQNHFVIGGICGSFEYDGGKVNTSYIMVAGR